MTRSPAWHARIDVDGAVEGSGFLVADRTVLTCAHVMRYRDRAEVVFPGAPETGPVPARVVDRGAWAGGDRDRGDLAVLELDRAVDIVPAVFAALGAPYASEAPKLVAYGFPDGYGEEGVQSELRATSRQLISDEWAQFEFWQGFGQETDRGFSGAAVMLEGGGTVVGMVVAHDPVTRNGRMIPAQVLARHWAVLADLVPTPGYPAEEKRRLRELVARCPALPGPLGPLVRAAAGPLGVEPPAVEPRSVWEAVWYLLSESTPGPGALPLAELAVRLAGLAGSAGDERLARELRDWSRAHRSRHDAATAPTALLAPVAPAALAPPTALLTPVAPATPSAPSAPEPSVPLVPPVPPAAPSRTEQTPLAPPAFAPDAPARRWSPILVEIRRSGADRGALLVEVSAYRDGSRRLVGQQRLAKREVRGWVLERIDDAFAEIDTEGRELIAFALPRGWLNQPVDQWTGRKSMSTPLGCVAPVVVMDHDRRASGRLQYRLKKIWDVLDRQPGSAVHRITCSGTVRPDRLTVQLQDVAGPVGLTRPPKGPRDRALYGAVLDAPAPIVLWPRTGCPGGALCGASCQGEEFLNRLAEQLSVLPPGELPERIFELRKRAFHHEGPEPHWAAELSFVWDDPRWFPDVARLSRSPVS
ncbi:serine protease [Streptomyces sp. GMY02]|uniref:VMAP-C domain-containing protein n=1 Tax=Streptomyces sp. GMY02 TaxID=1333528 RepID=UPI001C2B991C|nr:trypsin-like peptidase domain-containing protein [Streptomyces sp. GMY02]QXE34118.1 serine protease [Streptomyces sp. GMY02]